MSEPTEQQVEAVAWKRALDCAARQFENYYRADMLADPAQRRVALDDALQHAVGILSLAAAPRQADGWQPISSAPKDGTEIWLGREGRLILGYWSGKRGWMREGLQGEDERVMWEATHWQPHTVPEPPETGGKS